MGDKYTVGQAGAVGPDSHAHDMHFNQVWNQISQTTDLPQLAAELAKLRTESLKEATLPEHYTAIGALASAESSAKEGDGPKTMQQLANAGKWVLDIASKIGVTVAASAIKESLGIK